MTVLLGLEVRKC